MLWLPLIIIYESICSEKRSILVDDRMRSGEDDQRERLNGKIVVEYSICAKVPSSAVQPYGLIENIDQFELSEPSMLANSSGAGKPGQRSICPCWLRTTMPGTMLNPMLCISASLSCTWLRAVEGISIGASRLSS